jgi:heme oxygenase
VASTAAATRVRSAVTLVWLDGLRELGHVQSMIPGRQPLRALKDLTRDLHLRAEQYVRILGDDATTDDYTRYLIAMLGYHAPVEELLAAEPALAAPASKPRRAARATC